jgi:GNAT superfamily N-acetyltransferase
MGFLPLLDKMHSESGLKLPAVDHTKVLESLINSVVFAVEDKGIIALQEGEHWFSREKFIGDLVFYVDSDFRHMPIAVKLLREAQNYAKIRDLPLMLAVVDGNDIERKDAFYIRMGFQNAGGIYIWNM